MKDFKYKIGLVRNFGLVTLLIFILIRCEVVVDVPMPDFQTSLVVNSLYNSDSSIWVSLSSNKYVLDNRYDFPIVKGATVRLYEEGSLVAELLEYNDIGYYGAEYIPQPGLEYKITVEKSGFESASAMSRIPAKLANFKVEGISKDPNVDYNENVLTYSITDELGKDFYEANLFTWRKFYRQGYDEEKDSAYAIYQGEILQPISFVEEAPDLNGFEEYSSVTVFSDELFNGKTKEFKIKFSNYWNYDYYTGETNDTIRYVFQVRHLSEEYYQYVLTSQLQFNVDGDPFAEAVQVYNNIENGFGIFAGYNTASFEFEIINESN